MIVCLVALTAFRQQTLKLSPLFSDNMVLQRNRPVPFFGLADPKQTVTVTIDGQTVATQADDTGKWLVNLLPLDAGGPFTGTVQTTANTITLNNVMVGEVWVCSGQSNMDFREAQADDFAKAQDEADPAIRMFTVSKASTESPAKDVQGTWIPASKTTVGFVLGRCLGIWTGAAYPPQRPDRSYSIVMGWNARRGVDKS